MTEFVAHEQNGEHRVLFNLTFHRNVTFTEMRRFADPTLRRALWRLFPCLPSFPIPLRVPVAPAIRFAGLRSALRDPPSQPAFRAPFAAGSHPLPITADPDEASTEA